MNQKHDNQSTPLFGYALLKLILLAKENPDALFVVCWPEKKVPHSSRKARDGYTQRLHQLISLAQACSGPTVLICLSDGTPSSFWVAAESTPSLLGASQVERISHIPSGVDIKKSILETLTIGVRPKYHDELIRQLFSWWHSIVNSTDSPTLTLPARQLHAKSVVLLLAKIRGIF